MIHHDSLTAHDNSVIIDSQEVALILTNSPYVLIMTAIDPTARRTRLLEPNSAHRSSSYVKNWLKKWIPFGQSNIFTTGCYKITFE